MFNEFIMQIDDLAFKALYKKSKLLQGADINEEKLQQLMSSSIVQKDGSRALVTVDGPIVYNASVLDKLFYGAVDTKEIMQAMTDLMADDKIKDIVFAVNSPGGTAHKMNQLADMTYALAQSKNTAGVNTGNMASAAYYFASQLGSVFTDDELNHTGSIGTKAILYDDSDMFKNQGIKVIPVATGEFKAMLESGVEITEAQIGVIQNLVNEMQDKFNDAVNRTRPNANMSDGSEARNGLSFTADKASELGLIDGVKSVAQAFDFLGQRSRYARLKQSI
jgi:ClpP class serine protease